MKTIIPPTPILGTLDVLKVIDFFDEPLLYLAEGQDKTKWLCILIDQTDENNIWYAAQLSPKDVRHLLRGELDLFTVYSQSHDGYVIEVTLNRDTNDFISEQELQSNSVNKSLLPDPGDALRGNISDLHDIESPVDIKAAQTDRTLLRLDINFPQGYVGEAPIKVLGDLFTKLQDLLDAFAQAIFGEPTKKGPIPNEYRNKAKMNLVAIGSGSFELDLASKENSELFGFQDSSDIIDKFMQIVKLSDSEELFKEEIAKLEIRAAGKYLSFLETLRDNSLNTIFYKSSPVDGFVNNTALNNATIENVINTITSMDFVEPEVIQIVGVLSGGNSDKREFEIRTDIHTENEKKYQGKVGKDLKNLMSGAVLDKTYYAKLQKNTEIRAITGDPYDSYELLEIMPFDEV